MIIRKIIGPFREFGLTAGTLYAIDRVLRSISPRLGLYVYEFMVQPIRDKPLLTANFVRSLTYREIRRGDPEIAKMPARAEVKESRFAQGAVCLGAFRNDVLIAYIWLCFNAYQEDEVRCTYKLMNADESVFDFDLYVFPEHRMGIAFMAVWHGAMKYLHERGVRFSYSRLTRFNLASRRAHRHLGWKCIGRAVFLQIWTVEAMISTLFPFAWVSFGPPARVGLQFRPDALIRSSEEMAPQQ